MWRGVGIGEHGGTGGARRDVVGVDGTGCGAVLALAAWRALAGVAGQGVGSTDIGGRCREWHGRWRALRGVGGQVALNWGPY